MVKLQQKIIKYLTKNLKFQAKILKFMYLRRKILQNKKIKLNGLNNLEMMILTNIWKEKTQKNKGKFYNRLKETIGINKKDKIENRKQKKMYLRILFKIRIKNKKSIMRVICK